MSSTSTQPVTTLQVDVDRAEAIRRGHNVSASPVMLSLDLAKIPEHLRGTLAELVRVIDGSHGHTPHLHLAVVTLSEPTHVGLVDALALYSTRYQRAVDAWLTGTTAAEREAAVSRDLHVEYLPCGALPRLPGHCCAIDRSALAAGTYGVAAQAEVLRLAALRAPLVEKYERTRLAEAAAREAQAAAEKSVADKIQAARTARILSALTPIEKRMHTRGILDLAKVQRQVDRGADANAVAAVQGKLGAHYRVSTVTRSYGDAPKRTICPRLFAELERIEALIGSPCELSGSSTSGKVTAFASIDTADGRTIAIAITYPAAI